MSVYKKINNARFQFHKLQLAKSGHNKFAGYKYFELGDFLIPALSIFEEVGLCALVSFTAEVASMKIVDIDTGEYEMITSPLGSAALKGCHEVQNIGACETYQRRYLWTVALEIVEHDALDATTGKEDKKETKAAAPKKETEPTEVEVISKEHFEELQDLIERTGTDIKAVCASCKIDGLNMLPASKFAYVHSVLSKKLANG